jgi:alanyl-tRNA synthetase
VLARACPGVIILHVSEVLTPIGEWEVEGTRRLYFDDPYRIEFEAKVIERLSHEDKQVLVLDQTCFYPESGGQPFDTGTLDGVPVLQVLESNGNILHVVEKEIAGESVRGKIDWETRFDFMQQHAGQHILSQSLFELFNAETLSFHLGQEISTVEIDMRNISEEEAETAEKRSNEVVFEDREIKTYFVSDDEVRGIPLRKPPQKEGRIRVVEVSGFDYSACGGTHPRRTGEVGLIKILKWDKIRNNIRLEFICGGRSLRDYAQKNKILRQVALRFTVSEQEVPASIEKLSTDFKEQKKKIKKMRENMSRYEAQEMIQAAEGRIFKKIFEDRPVDEIKHLALNIINGGPFVVLFGIKLESRGFLLLACSESLGLDIRELIPIVSPIVEGRGGGSPSLIEIFTQRNEGIEEALDRACEHISKKNWLG